MASELKKFSACLLCFASFLLQSCTLSPNMLSVSAHKAGEDELIEVQMKSQDISLIKSRQIYFSMVVNNCAADADGYPVEPYINGQRFSTFKLPVQAGVMKIEGTMPASIFNKYVNPCMTLRGGSYFGKKITSTPMPITIKTR